MNSRAYWLGVVLLIVLSVAEAEPSSGAEATDSNVIIETIKKEVAQIVVGLNAHDVDKTTAYDSADVVSMECGSPSTIGGRIQPVDATH